MNKMGSVKTNGPEPPLNRADEASEVSLSPSSRSTHPPRHKTNTSQLIEAVKDLIIPFIRRADDLAADRASGGASSGPQPSSALVEGDLLPPAALQKHLSSLLPAAEGAGKEGLLAAISQILTYSVNTWDQGFLDKLYSSPNAVGLVSELLLAALNTNVHVYSVSPALTVVEKLTARSLARLFGFRGPRAGGVTAAGGSASNLTSLVIARAHLFPETKAGGNAGRRFAVFTSEHGHYSVSKAAAVVGLGAGAVRLVPVDAAGRMAPAALAERIRGARAEGMTPLYVNATAGTTVLGSYDPLPEVAAVCRREGVWMHVDASWGGGAVFSSSSAGRGGELLRGAELADSVTVNPHKMMNVPVTCSFLLGPDMRVFHQANRTDAPYLFHGGEGGEGGDDEVWDLADLTLQCGRRGDALKLALAWVYYGPAGLGAQVDGAFETAALLAAEIAARRPEFVLVSENPPPCLQVCFYHRYSDEGSGEANTRRTVDMVRRLRGRGFMVDYASFPKEFRAGEAEGGRVWKGSFFRVVVNVQTRRETVMGLVKALEEVGEETTKAMS